MSTASPTSSGARAKALLAFELVVIVPTLVAIVVLLAAEPSIREVNEGLKLVLWAALIAFVELLPIPAWRGVHLSLGFPLLMSVGMIFAPQRPHSRRLLARWIPGS